MVINFEINIDLFYFQQKFMLFFFFEENLIEQSSNEKKTNFLSSIEKNYSNSLLYLALIGRLERSVEHITKYMIYILNRRADSVIFNSMHISTRNPKWPWLSVRVRKRIEK